MTDQAFAQADPDWVKLISLAREWFNGPLGQLMLKEEEKLLEEELGRFFGVTSCTTGPAPSHRPARPRCSATCASVPRCRGWRLSAKSRPGR